MNTILILGDSSSMTLGIEQQTYPYFLAKKKIWPKNTVLLNGSQPGFTSAGIRAFFLHHKKELAGLRGVIIYIGNNDGVSTEIRQGKYSTAKHIFKKLQAIVRGNYKVNFSNVLTPYEWNMQLNPFIEQQENPSDYEYNVGRILKFCQNRSVPVVLVKPRANTLFPAGLGKGNFIFYRYILGGDKLSDKLSVFDSRLKKALALHEKNTYREATVVYQEILGNPSDVFSQEYPLMVVNNYAVAKAESGSLEEAEVLFDVLLKELWGRKEILLYNRAQIWRLKKNKKKYQEAMQIAYEADRSIFRIQKEFLQKLDILAKNFNDVTTLVDMHSFVTDRDYIDYCHCLPNAHKKLANRIAKVFAAKLRGTAQAVIKNKLDNPELALGNTNKFHAYLQSKSIYSPGEIQEMTQKLSSKKSEKKIEETLFSLPVTVQNAFTYYLRSPYFSSYRDIIRFGPKLSIDVGRFPEFFLIRHLLPFLMTIEKEDKLENRFGNTQLLRSSHQLASLLPVTLDEIGLDELKLDKQLDAARLDSILVDVKKSLIVHLQKKNQIHERLKTTIYWYFREALRFGFHSRTSMRYDRIFLEQAAEALAIADVINWKLKLKRERNIEKIAKLLVKTDTIHASYCSRFYLDQDNTDLLHNYDNALFDLLRKI